MVKTKYSIADENTYAVDEVGTNPLNGEWEWVMGGKKEGPQYQQWDDNWENMMAIMGIAADGWYLIWPSYWREMHSKLNGSRIILQMLHK